MLRFASQFLDSIINMIIVISFYSVYPLELCEGQPIHNYSDSWVLVHVPRVDSIRSEPL